MEYLTLVLLGLIVGFLSSFFAIGGGIIMVPALYWLFPNYSTQEILLISIAVIFLNTSTNTLRFAFKKLLPPRAIISILIIGCLIGSTSSSLLIQKLDSITIKKVFFFFLTLVIVKIYFDQKSKIQFKGESKKVYYFLTALLGSFISGLTGLGGGVIFTPAFVGLLKVPIKKYSAYSNITMAMACLFVLLYHLNLHSLFLTTHSQIHFNLFKWKPILIIYLFTNISSPLGLILNDKVTGSLKSLWLLLILGLIWIKMAIELF